MTTSDKKQVRPGVSLLISTYNWPQALELVLKSALRQTVLPDEIVIADDGSREDTKALIDSIRETTTLPVIHVWQEDKGFRAAKIRNKAIARCSKDYIVQIDGDCILERHFIQDHLSLAKENRFLCGRRVYLDPKATETTLRKRSLCLWHHPLSISYRSYLNNIRSGVMRRAFAKFYGKGALDYISGCNMSYWRKDVLAVNGYNEVYEGWGAEDDDLVVRLYNLGVEKCCIKGGAVLYHLEHAYNSQDRLGINRELLKKQIEKGTYRIEQGVSQYL
ncbi:glycosyltransferase family 2 protein [Porphyromonas sp.]|uniref:glycosyltransferase family 2 protein n=1 Tax=Porphyromonas sp. TaxID=1924944 RepID=UPI0026DB8429|nr:glycosyltransferase family 2 protein [Porphyromonas sp.]MDO4771726.1 glycosyltransferase family 2 protein [Porphyromonas sp.]